MRFSDKDIVGTYEAIGGSGKYEGMTLKGEFKPLGLPAPIVPGTVLHAADGHIQTQIGSVCEVGLRYGDRRRKPISRCFDFVRSEIPRYSPKPHWKSYSTQPRT